MSFFTKHINNGGNFDTCNPFQPKINKTNLDHIRYSRISKKRSKTYSGKMDSDELAELLRIAAEEEDIDLSVSKTSSENNSTNSQLTTKNDLPSSASASGNDKPIKLAEEAYDSSDEEDLQNFFERKYNEYGRDINTMLKRKDADRLDIIVGNEIDKNIRNSAIVNKKSTAQQSSFGSQQQSSGKVENVFIDPIFGIRIVQPLISSSLLRERMTGRQPIEIRFLQNFLQNADTSKDWCISGVIVSKSPVQTSNAGSQYIIWKMSDLKGDMKQVSLFLFKNAYKELWKTAQGMVVAVLNPSVFSRKDASGESSISIDSAQRVMILGRSKDYGTCKSKKKNGEMCTAIVNLNACEYCVYHVKQEYGKLSTRSELQSATSGRGLQSLKNKVLGKSEVFYGGKSFIAEPAKQSKKVKAKDQQRLATLSNSFQSSPLASHINSKYYLSMEIT